MPQLDRLIIFPQIFWFFTIFIIFYSLIIHYFLPKFLFSLKLRKYIVDFDYLIVRSNINTSANTKMKFLNQIAVDLNKINACIYLNTNNLKSILKDHKYTNPLKLNFKVLTLVKDNVLFCNQNLLNLIELYPSNLNLKKLK